MSRYDALLDRCGCCELPFPGTPSRLYNRPSLDEIAYRIGTYGSFRQAMLRRAPIVAAALAVELGLPAPPLTGWFARHSDDYGIAIIDLWATVADILTFYQERYANEAFLRTADRRDSVRMLANLLGYRLNPGKAAATHLVFTLEKDTQLEIAAGTRAQSVPKEGEVPQKYETSAALAAESTLNEVPCYLKPAHAIPLQGGRRSGTLRDASHVPAVGERFLAFGATKVEERMVDAVAKVDERSVITWSRPFTADHTAAHMLGRMFRLFAHNGPTHYMTSSEPVGTPTTVVEWTRTETVTAFEDTDMLCLDGTVDGIEVGSQVLVVTPYAVPTKLEVEEVAHQSATVPPLTGAVTTITLSGVVSGDYRTTVLYELGEELAFQPWEIPAEPIPKGTADIYVPYPEVESLAKGHLVVLDDKDGRPHLTEAAADATAWHIAAGPPEFLKIPLASATPRMFDEGSARLHGNVVAATHGETVADETLGDGDASTTLQSFRLKKAPVTHVADATAAGGAASTLQVLVDGVKWAGRTGLYGAGAIERVYTTAIDDEQKTTVTFGDGSAGARLSTGKANVVASYRQGLGSASNVDAGQISTALDRPAGLKTVTNPVEAKGGVNPETIGEARANAPNTVRTFDRAVSLRDFEDLALEHTDVSKALATWVWQGEQRTVHLTVAGPDGVALDTTQRGELRTYLDLRRDRNRSMLIAGYVPVAVEVEVAVEVAPDRLADDVEEAVRNSVGSYFDFDNCWFGGAVHLSDVYAVVQTVAGVIWARVDVLRYKDPAVAEAHGAGTEPVIAHLGMTGACLADGSDDVQGAELARIATAGDLRIKPSGGLA